MLLSLHAQCMHHTFFSLHVQYLHSACTLPIGTRKDIAQRRRTFREAGSSGRLNVAASTSCVISSASVKCKCKCKCQVSAGRKRPLAVFLSEKSQAGRALYGFVPASGRMSSQPFRLTDEGTMRIRSKIRTILQIMYRTGEDRRENAACTIRKCRIRGQTKLQAPQNSAYRIESVKYGRKFSNSLPIRPIATFMQRGVRNRHRPPPAINHDTASDQTRPNASRLRA